MSVGKLARIFATSHRSSVVGRPVYDLGGLASDEPRPIAVDSAGGVVRLAYLRSPLRQPIEAAVAAELSLEARADDPVPSMDALLGLLSGRFAASGSDCTGDRARIVSALLAEYSPSQPGEPSVLCGSAAGRARELRARLLASASRAPSSTPSGELRDRARREARAGLDAAIEAGLRHVVAAQALELRRLELELDSALSEAMLHETTAARERSASRR